MTGSLSMPSSARGAMSTSRAARSARGLLASRKVTAPRRVPVRPAAGKASRAQVKVSASWMDSTTQLTDELAREKAEAKRLMMELSTVRRELSSVKSDRDKGAKRVAELSERMQNAERRCEQYASNMVKDQNALTAARAELTSYKEVVSGLRAELGEAKKVAAESTAKLAAERGSREKAEETVATLRERMTNMQALAAKRSDALQKDQAAATEELKTEKAKSEELAEQIKVMKEEFHRVADSLETEQDSSNKTRLEMGTIKRELATMASAKTKADKRISELTERLGNAEKRAAKYGKDMVREQAAREDATKAVNQLQSAIVEVKKDVETAKIETSSFKKKFSNERNQRQQAEEAVNTLRTRMTNMQAVQAARSKEAQEAMESFAKEMNQMKNRSEQAWESVQEGQSTVEKLREEIAALKDEDDLPPSTPNYPDRSSTSTDTRSLWP